MVRIGGAAVAFGATDERGQLGKRNGRATTTRPIPILRKLTDE